MPPYGRKKKSKPSREQSVPTIPRRTYDNWKG